MTTSELERRLSEATGASRELDALLYVSLHDGDASEEPSEFGLSFAPEYTASVDAALALVERKLPGWRMMLQIGTAYDVGVYQNVAGCSLYHPISSGAVTAKGFAPNVPLAILIALIRALATQEPTNG